MKIAIIGAGAFGTALGGVLSDKGFEISYYDSKLINASLSDVLDGAMLSILAVPSDVVPHLLPYLPKTLPLLVATKGLFDDKLLIDFDKYDVISGPGFASDIKAHRTTELTITDSRVRDYLSTDYLSFDYTTDITGVLLCGALKNVYALLAGYLNLIPHSAAWQDYIASASHEMRDILALNGASPATVDLACGLPDLKLTCNRPSRNYEFGRTLSHNSQAVPIQTVEGLTALRKIKNGAIKIPGTAVRLKYLIEESQKWN